MSILSHEPSHDGGNSGPGWPFTGLPTVTGAEIETAARQRRDAARQSAEGIDRRAQVNPAWLVQEVANMLRAKGKPVDLDGRYQTTLIAAADLLQAMGLRAANSPTIEAES